MFYSLVQNYQEGIGSTSSLRISLVIPGLYRNTSDVGWLSSSHPPKEKRVATCVLNLHKTCVDGSRPEFISLLCCTVVVCNIIYLA